MRVAFLDVAAGVAGDMVLGALLDAGWSAETLQALPARLGLTDVTVEIGPARRGALAATSVDVRVGGVPADSGDHHAPGGARHLSDVLAIVRSADLPREVADAAASVFEALAQAEGRVHGEAPEHVHFHEVGMDDALVDVVGVCLGLHELGVEAVYVGPLPVGRGTVESAHGRLALPAPAVLHLMEGHPTVPSEEVVEQVTPTGAALVRALAQGARLPPGFVGEAVGVGAGRRDSGLLPNVVRLWLGRLAEAGAPGDAWLLETNLDDATGQEVARAIEALLEAGALDAWSAAITMKKGRPGHCVSALAAPGTEADLERVFFDETPTLGVRRRRVERTVLARSEATVSTPWGDVRVKVRETPSGPRATPEHDDCLAVARRAGVPVRDVLEAARRAW